MRFDELAGRRVVIWGAGREGRAAHAELARRGVPTLIAVTGDGAVPEDLRAAAVTGDAALRALLGAEVVVKSPGIPRTSPDFQRIVAAGVPVTSLMDLWLNDNADRVIAVTGTKGKSTTSSLIRHLLEALGVSAVLAGNVGVAVAGDLDPAVEAAVTEVSSYQASDLTASPRVAVLTSLYPEHLPWHGGYERYVADKLNLVAHGPEVVVVPSREHELHALAAERAGERTRIVTPGELGIRASEDRLEWDGAGALSAEELPLRGAHNLANAALALTALHAYTDMADADRGRALAALRDFAPLQHRLEVVPSSDGRVWVDDGLATAPQAVVAALEAYADARVTLIAGGAERDLPFAPLIGYLTARGEDMGGGAGPVRVVATGPSGARLLAEAGGRLPRAELARDFADALDRARAGSVPGEVILLSPGAPSFDEFADYEARAAAFRAAAERA
ncbi:UDP-N-acetylmuramoyl-L-alanine--D-glutamate ligase [Leucobacter massiliensis]|uniref:UDP-N-acetylmuramoylalanine--D-glutamate ligase n=1 Tax=Leucobacter massiliensis TaxID=1686285 RepID=A0A2S9QQ55_9MICO|nr:UDP-N-acetylmuramoyl-L-alanine--D-glutamate ligase [Leucobacter massiliensis]PRI11714.1 UDP-N-acetylmuramoyl-L-alanine--D-glutamate ligase [Leucobacter massiliensis]